MNFLKTVFLILLFSFFSVFSQTLVHPINLNFEQSEEGGVPLGWTFVKSQEQLGYRAYATHAGAIEEQFCLQIQNIHNSISEIKNPEQKPIQGVVYQIIDAEYFWGKDVYFGLKYKVLNPGKNNYAFIFIQQENTDLLRRVSSDTLRNADWSDASISMRIDSNAKIIKFGMISYGVTSTQFDDAVFNFTFDFVKNHPPLKITNEISKNLLDLAKVFGSVKYFFPSPYLKNYPWDALLYTFIDKAVKLDSNKFIQNLTKTFTELTTLKSFENDNTKSAANYIYVGLPVKENSPLSSKRLSDIYKPNKEYPATLINFYNLNKEKINEIEVSVNYKFSPYSLNGNTGLWLRFDNSSGISLNEVKTERITEENTEWKTASIKTKVPDSTSLLRIGLVLEGDGQVKFDNLKVFVTDSTGKRPITIRNDNFESPLVNNFISGWNFPTYSQNVGYSISLSDDAFEGKHSIMIFSSKENLIKFPPLNWAFSDTLSGRKIFKTPTPVPISCFNETNNIDFNIPDNFAINFNDSYSRFAIIIDLWNYIRHFSYKEVTSTNLEDYFLGAIYDANYANSLASFEKTLNGLVSVSNDVNYKIWNGFDNLPYFPDLGIFTDGKSVFAFQSDSLGIKSGSKLTQIDNYNIDSLIKISIQINNKNNLNNNFIIKREISKILSGDKNSIRKISFIGTGNKIKEVKVKLNVTGLRSIKKPNYTEEISPGIIYLNSSFMTDEELRLILPKLQNKEIKGMIIDLRGYSLFSEHILGLFTDKLLTGFVSEIPIYTAPYKSFVSKSVLNNNLQSNPKLVDKKVVFLIDENSNSYSEIIAGLARVNKIGTVLGSPSQGNITEVEQIVLPGYFFASQSILRIKLQNDQNFLDKQIAPDKLIKQTLKSVLENKDDQIDAAIEMLK